MTFGFISFLKYWLTALGFELLALKMAYSIKFISVFFISQIRAVLSFVFYTFKQTIRL
jgi:hypothetical protein